MSELPESWARAPIGDLCELVNGRAFKPSEWETEGLPIIRIQNLNRPDAPFNRFSGPVEDRHIVSPGELLFAWSGTPGTSFGAHVWNGERAVLNQHIFRVLFTREAVDRDFFRFAINTKLEELIDKAHGGVGLRHVTKGKFEETSIELPPLGEQRRIVAKLDGLIGRTARARKELDRVPILVARYKQAILASAFSGRLTEGLRRSSNDEQWATNRTFGDLVTEGPTNGWSPPSSPDAQGALSLKLTATTSGVLRLDNAAVKRIHEVPPQNSKYWLSPGDLLIQRSNSIEHVGASAIFEGPAFTYIYPDLMMRVRFVDSTTTKYVWRYLNSEFVRAYFRERATGTAGNMPKINGAVLRSLPVPLPSPSEMAEIVRRIDSAFEWLDKLAAEHAHASALLPKLEQALLAKAFRGELVPQDPNDEPASVLLERIRAERAAAPERKRKPRSKDLLGELPVLRTTIQSAEHERADRGNGRQGKLVPVAGR